jgi:hypothetical protein
LFVGHLRDKRRDLMLLVHHVLFRRIYLAQI